MQGALGDICISCQDQGVTRCDCCQDVTRHRTKIFGVFNNPRSFQDQGHCLSCGLDTNKFRSGTGLCINCTTGTPQLMWACSSCAPRIQKVCINQFCKTDIEIQDENMECLSCRLSKNWEPTAETRIRLSKCNTCGEKATLGKAGICKSCHVKNELFQQNMASEVFECTRCGSYTHNDDLCDMCLRSQRKCKAPGCTKMHVPYHFDDNFCDMHKPRCPGCRHRSIVDSKSLCATCITHQYSEKCTYCGKSTVDSFSDEFGHCFDCANSLNKK